MNNLFTNDFEVNGNVLRLLALSNERPGFDFDVLNKIVGEEFSALGGFIKENAQILFIRDNVDLSIEGTYPAGHTYFPTEAMIAVPSWRNLDLNELRAVIAHELHHMARWQNVGYGTTLGGAIASEGIATFYEEIRSGRKPKWAESVVSVEALAEAKKEWNSQSYNHQEWFYDGPYGRWIGYSLGYELAKKYFAQFDIEASISLDAKELHEQIV